MVVGLLHLSLAIPGARSLKDKRRVIRSLKDRLSGKHNVSVAEVEDLDKHRCCGMALAMVSNDRRFTDSCLSKIVDEIRRERELTLIEYEIELI